mgnify:CR=1 FL=1
MSKISVTTIAGLTSGGDANKVKIEDGDTFEVVNGSQTINRTGNGGILLGGLDAYADDAAAGAAGLPKDKLYQTDGSDPALPIAGIVMIKQ